MDWIDLTTPRAFVELVMVIDKFTKLSLAIWLKMQYKDICQAIRIMIVLCMRIVSNCGKKTRLRNRYEKVLILILWRCGDIESNPGPPIADIMRDFCKKMISLLVIKYWERKEGVELSRADYKRKPSRWPEHVWFGDPSTCKEKELRNTMLRHLHETCLREVVEVPNQWLTLIEKYHTLLSNGCSKSQKKQYADDLYSWLCQLRSFETADQLVERISGLPDQERNCVLQHLFKKLKEKVPDTTISQMSHETRETATETVLVEKGISKYAEPIGLFIDVEDNGKAEIPEALRDACYNTSNAGGSNNFTQETHTSSITDFGEFGKADNNTVTGKIDVTNYNKGSKRKLDLTGYQGQHIPSKRQSTSSESNVRLLTKRENDALDDLMEIIQSEQKTNRDDNCVLD